MKTGWKYLDINKSFFTFIMYDTLEIITVYMYFLQECNFIDYYSHLIGKVAAILDTYNHILYLNM